MSLGFFHVSLHGTIQVSQVYHATLQRVCCMTIRPCTNLLHKSKIYVMAHVMVPASVWFHLSLCIICSGSFRAFAKPWLLWDACYATHNAHLLAITATKLQAAALMPELDQHSQWHSHLPSKTTNLDLWKLQPHLLPAALREPGIMWVAYHCHFVTCASTFASVRINTLLMYMLEGSSTVVWSKTALMRHVEKIHHRTLSPCAIFLQVYADIQEISCHT